LDAATSAAANATAGLHKPLIFIFFLLPPVSLQAASNVAAPVQTGAVVVVVACVQTVWPQSGALSCDLLTRRICTPAAATNSHGLYFFFLLFLFFFKDKSLCFQRGKN
jgi:hypothetical protein